ncbi:hypothetical protein EV649_5996 [Kribbella sp. VKM Ac-2569]|uniref:hypothetical protein n=1 Tax=Kribbella sp. VKM Ac-2569 TaxID=2512220 RepID=UPI00102D13F9|nr:hypothetical protein [Kribbella sp. VKM Ac-2569]RZT15210.1 hypothetical protein EV649_5996 [Kribbella sp. VKM Ac-2569]
MLHPAATPILTAATHGSELAATIHTAEQAATVTLIVTAVAGLYLLTCAVWPFGKCRKCKGVGKFKSPFGKAYRHCPRCKGTGLRVRFGRHIINRIRATRGAGTNSTSKGER